MKWNPWCASDKREPLSITHDPPQCNKSLYISPPGIANTVTSLPPHRPCPPKFLKPATYWCSPGFCGFCIFQPRLEIRAVLWRWRWWWSVWIICSGCVRTSSSTSSSLGSSASCSSCTVRGSFGIQVCRPGIVRAERQCIQLAEASGDCCALFCRLLLVVFREASHHQADRFGSGNESRATTTSFPPLPSHAFSLLQELLLLDL